MKKTTLLLVLLVFSLYSWSQTIVIGQIVDEDDIPISYATVKSSINKVSSNLDGYFSVACQGDSVMLTVSHVGYQTQKVPLGDLEFFVRIGLAPKVQELKQVNIKQDKVFKYPLGFEIADNVIYSLLIRKNKRWLQATSIDGAWAIEERVSKNIDGIQKDCFGNVHLIGDKNVVQLIADSNQITNLASISVEEFEYQLAGCQASSSSSVVSKKYQKHNQHLTYDVVYKGELHEDFAQMWHEEKTDVAASYHRDIINRYDEVVPIEDNVIENGLWDGDLVKLFVHDFEIIERVGRYLHFLSKPLYCPVFTYQSDKYLVFDFVEGMLNTYSEQGLKLDSSLVVFHNSSSWSDKIIKDEATDSYYAVFVQDGVFSLGQIDVNTGRMTYIMTIEDEVFPANIRINDGVAYFITKSDFHAGQNRINQQVLKR